MVHQTNHARYTTDGRYADANEMERDAYVAAAVDEEIDGTVQQIVAAKEFREAGFEIDQQPAEAAYDAALDPSAEKAWLDALFAMRYDNPAHREMMDLEGLKAWLPERTTGFGPLTAAVESERFFAATAHERSE